MKNYHCCNSESLKKPFDYRNVSETFLRTPFFDGNEINCQEQVKFQQFLSPIDAGNETININDIHNANLDEFYFQTKVNCEEVILTLK